MVERDDAVCNPAKTDSEDSMRRFSVVIPNFNYEAYVANAITSVLDSDWPDVEIIVVDDGSSDGSRRIIETFEAQICSINQPNGGHRAACNSGYAKSTGDIVVFLDSDDVLLPNALTKIDASWTERTSKVQVQLSKIDAHGNTLNQIFPKYPKDINPVAIRRWYRTTGAHPTPPGSGNAYARWFLEKVMPVDDSADSFIDSTLLASAPLYGEVVTIQEPLVQYRVHSANDSDLAAVPTRFDREVARAVHRAQWVNEHCAGTHPPGIVELRKSRELLQFRVAARAVTPMRRSFPGDSDASLLFDIARSIASPGPHTFLNRVVIMLWCFATFIAPARLRPILVQRRYGRR